MKGTICNLFVININGQQGSSTTTQIFTIGLISSCHGEGKQRCGLVFTIVMLLFIDTVNEAANILSASDALA